MDVSLSVTKTEIRDVISPYGLLRDSIPIPGEVVQEMANSISTVLQSYPPSILLSTDSLTFVVDEARGVSTPKSVQITNDGILGSLLAATITSSASYLSPVPANIDGLASSESGSFDVTVDSTALLSSNSPYTGTLTVQGSGASNTPQTIDVDIIVRPLAEITTTPTSMTFNVVKPITGGFPAIPSQLLTVSNTGPATSVLDFQIKKVQGVSWLVSYSPIAGSLNGGSSQGVTVVVAPQSNMLQGVYTETLRITGYSSNQSVDVDVTLNIT